MFEIMKVIITMSSKDQEYYLTFFSESFWIVWTAGDVKIKITKVSNQRINVLGSVPKGKKISKD